MPGFAQEMIPCLSRIDVLWGRIFLRVRLPTMLEKHINYSHCQSPFRHLKHHLTFRLAFPHEPQLVTVPPI